MSFALSLIDNTDTCLSTTPILVCVDFLDVHALAIEMGLFTRKKVDGEVGTDLPTSNTTASGTTNGKTGISRFGRRRKDASDVPASRSATAGAVSDKAMRLVQLLLAILILGLVSYAVNIYRATFVSEHLTHSIRTRQTDKIS